MLGRPNSLSLSHSGSVLKSIRARLIICLTIYGGALGGASFLVNLLSRTRFPQEPQHLSLTPTVFLSGGAVLAGAILAGLLAYWVSNDTSKARSLLVWAFLGFTFGILSPFLTGALIPLSTVFLNLVMDVITVGDVPRDVVDSILRAPGFAFTHGVFGLFTGMLAGALFGGGAWLIDMANASPKRGISIYGTYLIAIGLSIAFFAIAAFGPPSALASLG